MPATSAAGSASASDGRLGGSGLNKSIAEVEVQADCGGQICERNFAEEMGNCSRICHTPTYCFPAASPMSDMLRIYVAI